MSSAQCADSNLSITGNVVGILTFAYAILASVYLYIRQTTQAWLTFTEEIREAFIWLASRHHEFDRLRAGIAVSLHQKEVRPEGEDPYHHERSVRDLCYRAESAFSHLRNITRKFDKSKWDTSSQKRIAMRARWIANKAEFNEHQAEVERVLSALKDEVQDPSFSSKKEYSQIVTMLEAQAAAKDVLLKQQADTIQLLRDALSTTSREQSSQPHSSTNVANAQDTAAEP